MDKLLYFGLSKWSRQIVTMVSPVWICVNYHIDHHLPHENLDGRQSEQDLYFCSASVVDDLHERTSQAGLGAGLGGGWGPVDAMISMVRVGNRADRNRPCPVQSSARFFALGTNQCRIFVHWNQTAPDWCGLNI